MTIYVNKSTDRIEKPTVSINGVLVGTEGSRGGGGDRTMTNDIEADSTVSTNWRNQEVTIFNEDVTITLTPDTKFRAISYGGRTESDFVGTQRITGGIVGGSGQRRDGGGTGSETYYSTNGKTPKRTKSNLYITPFRLRRNVSGSDNVILKARTYYNGKWSEVFTTEFRIVKKKGDLRI